MLIRFEQEDPRLTCSSQVSSDFGLIDRTYDTDADFDPEGRKTQWERFENVVRTLNDKADHHTQYKVLYMGRHGQGYHNVAESYYGTEAWDVSPRVLWFPGSRG
jgi:hypothetical protein